MENNLISAVVLTRNEKENILRCLISLAWVDEIIIVDDYSTDKTIDKIRNKAKIQIYERRLNGDFAAQRNFGLEKTRGEWVLFVDGDEVISDKLSSEIKSQISRPTSHGRSPGGRANLKSQSQNLKRKTKEISGYYLKRRDWFLGRWLKYGETANVQFLRLARKGRGIWQGRVHEKWKVRGKTGLFLKNPILHYPHQTVSEFLQEINRYTDIVAQCWKEEGKKVTVWEILLFPLGKFLQNYFLRGGFLDGAPGLMMALFMSFHSFLARAKLWKLTNNDR